MLFNPATGDLFDEDGTLLKRVQCPLGIDPASLSNGVCTVCRHEVVDLSALGSEDALRLLRREPEVCVLLDPDAPNVRMVG